MLHFAAKTQTLLLSAIQTRVIQRGSGEIILVYILDEVTVLYSTELYRTLSK
jgi:hypothetical protein